MLPNNDFCYGEEDFLSEERRETQRHWDRSREAWEEIKSLKGDQVTISSSKDGNVTWKVVNHMMDDDMKEIKDREDSLLKTASFVKGVKHNSTSDLFWKLWPTEINDDVHKFNKEIYEINKERKEHYQKVSKPITKSELMIFIALLIEASVHRL